MGMRGPAPKPTAIRRFEGNPSRRPFNEHEPQYPLGIPDKPKKLSRAARPVWDELVNEMGIAGVLCRVDARALAQLAEDEALLAGAYNGIWQLVKRIEQQAKTSGKKLDVNPIFQLMNQTSGRLGMSAIRHLANRVIIERREFGLTPSSRSRIEGFGEGTGAIDPLELKLCGKLSA